MEKGFESWFQDRKLNLPNTQFGFGNTGNSSVKEVKKFLVFDKSGDQTTLIYSSGHAPIRYQYPPLYNPKPHFYENIKEKIKENVEDDSRSEMREDSEELNALLYSDEDDDFSENDYDFSENEEMSTGHSPSSMIRFNEQKRENKRGEEEEVASSGGPTKRRKLEDTGKIVDSLEDTASSGESGINCSGNDNSSSGNKRSRKEKMKETINLIQNLIPGDKNGKNAIMVIDEAIHYLVSLKAKAEALGLDTL